MKKKITALIFLFAMLVAFETHAATYKIKGTFNGWADVTLTQTQRTEYSNTTPLYCKASQSWSEICIYESESNYYYQSNGNTLSAGSDYYFGSNSNNISTSLNAGKSYVFYLETNMKKVYAEEKYNVVYLRGNMGSTNWDLSDDYVFATTDGNEYTFAVSSMTNATEFKVYNRGTDSWFGYNELTLSGANFSNNGGNIKLNEDLTDVIITYNASAKTLKVSKVIDTYTLKVGSTEANLSSSDDGATYTGTTTLSASQAITLLKNGTETLYASETATYTGGDATYTMTGTSGGVTTGSGEFSGNYNVTYTTADQKLTISGASMTIPTYTVIVFGAVEGGNWSGAGITLTQVEGTTTYTGTVKMQDKSKHFRVKIGDSQYGPQSTSDDAAITLGTLTQMYPNDSKALSVPTEGASYVFTVDAAAKTLIVAQEDTYNVKYTTDGWSSSQTPAMTKQEDGTYTYTFNAPADGMQLCLQKNGNDFWSGDADRSYTGTTKSYNMGTGARGDNITFSGSFSGDHTLSYNPTTQVLTITPPASETISVKVIGTVNNSGWDDQVGVSLAQVGTTSTYQGKVKLTGTSFRIVLGADQFGPQTDAADEPVTIGTAKKMYNNYKTALTVSDALKYIFTVDATAKTVKLDYINFVIRTSAADNFNTDAYTFSTTDGKTYTCSGVTLDAGTQLLIKEAGDEVWLGKSNLTVSGADITAGDTGTNNIKLVSGIKNATVTFDVTNYSLTIVSEEEVKQFPDSGENYIWGDATLTFEYRNDDNPSAAWTSIPLTFDKYDSTTNPYGLEAYASEPFEVAVKNLDWRIRTSTGYIVRKGASTAVNVWLENFCKDLTTVNNEFTGLTPGVKYRIVIDTTHGDGDRKATKANPKIGIFAAESSYPWGEIDELYLHGNFTGSWPANTGNTDEANHLKYYPDSKIWSVSFTTGEKQSFSDGLGASGTGYEFCLRNMYSYIWFKDIYNFPVNKWVSGEVKIQTVDNNGNYYSTNLEAGTSYMLQVRINPEDETDYQIRIVKSLSAESLYIVGKDTSNGLDASQPDTFTQYKDENGAAIEGRYYYTINYTGEGFKISTAKGTSSYDWDTFNAALLSPADNTANNGNDPFNATIDTPYTYTSYGTKDKGTGNWVISDGPGYYSIILDEIAQTVTIVRPSIRVISDIKLNTYTGELSAEHAQALTTADKMPKGATAETPVYYNNVNYLEGTINILADQIPTGLSLTITDVKVTVNGTDTYDIDGTFAKGLNIVNLLPYGGTHATYQVSLGYSIGNDDGAIGAPQTVTSDIVTINLVDDFEAPLTFDATEMKRQFYHNGETLVVSALVEAPVDFNSVYNVYPGFAVTVARDLSDNATIIGNNGKPIGTNWEDMDALIQVSYLSSYDGTANTNWSSAAYNNNKLPVAVTTTLEFADLSDAAKMPQIKYELFGHYPIIDLVGTANACGGHLIGSGVAAKIARTAETPVTTLSPSTNVADYRLSVYTTTADRSVTTKFSTTDITTGIADFDAEAADGEEIYFNLQGVRITNPQSGIYIRYNGRTFDKVYIR